MSEKPSEIFSDRADAQKERADSHWASAKNGEGDHNYADAKRSYGYEKENREKSENYKKQGK